MSNLLSITIPPEAIALAKRLGDQPAVLKTVAKTMDLQNDYSVSHIQSSYLSQRGPDTLGVITGLLRRSARRNDAVVSGNSVLSAIGTNVVYGAAHEFGVDKEVTVKQFTRRNPAGDKFESAGQTVSRITALRAGLLTQKQAGKVAVESGKYTFVGHGGRGARHVRSGGAIVVRAHTMHMKIKARGMFQHGIADRMKFYGPAIGQAMMDQWGGKN